MCNKRLILIFLVELEQMLAKDSLNLENIEAASFDHPWCEDNKNVPTVIYGHDGSGSGGYSDHILKFAAKELFGMEIEKVEYKNLRNPDFKEVTLEKDGKVLLKFAIANGFRNIQNLVQKLKRGKSLYHYVEVMACPSG